jgi:SAM-dependent methyltransferase
MFTASAELYDLIYSTFKDYPAEATEIATLVRREHSIARTVLDVACGTAEHARLLTDQHGFEVDGLDLDPAFARIARRKLPRGSVYEGDMTSFELSRRYDVILCLFSSIGYVRTLDNVRRTLERFRGHLDDRGIVMVEPWFGPDFLEPGRITINTAKTAEVSVARMSVIEVEDRQSRIRFEYLIGRGGAIERASEVHELGLFTTDEMLGCFRDAGFAVSYDPKGPSGRGLFVGRAAARSLAGL